VIEVFLTLCNVPLFLLLLFALLASSKIPSEKSKNAAILLYVFLLYTECCNLAYIILN
jgi:hypothetical protein